MNFNTSILLMGGLGNMMFQAALVYAYSKKYNRKPILNYYHTGTLHGHPKKYENNIFNDFHFTEEDINQNWTLKDMSSNTSPCSFLEIDNFEINNLLFKGFFQSYKYFDFCKTDIQSLYSPSEEIHNQLTSKYNPQEFVSIHIRKGDYTNLTEFHHNLNLEYYLNAIDYFDGQKFLIFSDDIKWCKENFKGEMFNYVEEQEDYMDLYLMSLCKHNIIANSTFSWWGGYINQNPNKKVIYPEKWFGSKNSHKSIYDLFPDEWVCLRESKPKITVNLMGNICRNLTKSNKRWSTVHEKISSDVKITRNEDNFDGVTLFSDDTIETGLVNQNTSKKKIGWLIATRAEAQSRYNNFENYMNNYEFTMTHDSTLLENYPENTKFIPFGGSWIKDSNFNIYEKSKSTSMILSSKNDLPGHRLRHQLMSHLNDSGVDFYGRGTNNPIKNKEDALIDYYYSISIENSKTDNYFTEKLLDCFAVGTIPIYWGCSNIGDFFNKDGIIHFDNVNDIYDIIPMLTVEYYQSKLKAIQENLKICREYAVTEDWMYNNILKEL